MKDQGLTASNGRSQHDTTDTIEYTLENRFDALAIVEDDQPFREALAFELCSAGFQAALFPSAESFLESLGSTVYDCIIADICLPGINGLQLLREIKDSIPFASVVFITGSGDISIGVQAMREGAVDCLQKPLNDEALLNAIRRGIDLCRIRAADDKLRLELQKRARTLTPREHEVFGLVTTGLLNKQIGAVLGATERTIKTHRGRVMDKMDADSLADLVRMAQILQIQTILSQASSGAGRPISSPRTVGVTSSISAESR